MSDMPMNADMPLEFFLPLMNVKAVKPEHIIVYSWLVFRATWTGSWEVDYKELSQLTGLSIMKLSTSIAALEKAALIEVERGPRRIRAYPLDIPDRLRDIMERNMQDINDKQAVKKLAKQQFG